MYKSTSKLEIIKTISINQHFKHCRRNAVPHAVGAMLKLERDHRGALMGLCRVQERERKWKIINPKHLLKLPEKTRPRSDTGTAKKKRRLCIF